MTRFGRPVLTISDEERLTLTAVRSPRYSPRCQTCMATARFTPSIWRVGHVINRYGTEVCSGMGDHYCDVHLPIECHEARAAILATASGATHAQVQAAAARWYSEPYRRIAMVEFALPWTRTRRATATGFEYDLFGNMFADVLGFDVYRERYHIIECKTSRSDFLRGQKKFDAYREWCDCFYVAAPEGVVHKSDLPTGVGLLTIRHDGTELWADLVRTARAKHTPQISKTAEGERLRLRILTWLLAYYEGHRHNCKEHVPLPLEGVWKPVEHFDHDLVNQLVAQAQEEVTNGIH